MIRSERYGERYEGTWADPCLPTLVGRSIGGVRVTFNTQRLTFDLTYAGRTRSHIISEFCERHRALPQKTLIRSLHIEAEIMAHIANAADRIAHQMFDTPVLLQYYSGRHK
jgi:hypothetical protein